MAESKKATPKASKTISVNFKEMPKSDLILLVKELKEESLILKRSTIMGDVQNVRAYKFKRRELAKALTALNSKGTEETK